MEELISSAQSNNLNTECSRALRTNLLFSKRCKLYKYSVVLSPLIDDILFVIRHNFTQKQDAVKAIQELRGVDANFIGYITNDVPLDNLSDRHRYYLN